MLVLAFDTSTPAVTVAVNDLDGRCVERTVVDARRHGELLAPLIQQALADAGAKPRDLTAVAVGLGPGPFTGLRVGIATAAAMAHALDIPVYATCSLDVLAARHVNSAPLGIATDARRREVYWAAYDEKGERLEGPNVDVPATAAGRLRAAGSTTVAGEGAVLYRDAFAELHVIDNALYPQAGMLIEVVAARVREGAASDALRPLYLRRPDAVPPGERKVVTPR